jgi:hypothetical protein
MPIITNYFLKLVDGVSDLLFTDNQSRLIIDTQVVAGELAAAKLQGEGALAVNVTFITVAAAFAGQGQVSVKVGIKHEGQAEPCRLVSVPDAEDRYLTAESRDVDREPRHIDLPPCGVAA